MFSSKIFLAVRMVFLSFRQDILYSTLYEMLSGLQIVFQYSLYFALVKALISLLNHLGLVLVLGLYWLT